MVAFDRAPASLEGQTLQPSISVGEMGETMDVLRSLASHLALAASQMASDPGVAPGIAARYHAAAVQLRAQAADCGLGSQAANRGPAVRLENGEEMPLTVHFAGLYDRRRWWLPLRSIDTDLVLLAKELLSELKWHLPDEDEGQS